MLKRFWHPSLNLRSLIHSTNLGLPPSIVVPAEGDLRKFSKAGNVTFSQTVLLSQKEKITGIDFDIARDIVFIASRKGKSILGYRLEGMYFLHITTRARANP